MKICCGLSIECLTNALLIPIACFGEIIFIYLDKLIGPDKRVYQENIFLVFLFLPENICCGYSLEEALLMSTTTYFLWRNK